MSGTVVLAWHQEPEHLNPYLFLHSAAGEISVFMCEGLLDYEDGDDLRFYPRLAREVPTVENGGIAEDGRSVTYRLREGLRWCDGKPLRAADLRFTWQAIVDQECGSTHPGGYRDIAEVECPDDDTVVVRYRDLYSPFLTRFDCVLPEHATGPPARMREWAYNRHPVGAGPFRMVEWVSGSHIRMERNPYYRGAPRRPALDEVVIRFVPAMEDGVALMEAGEVHALWTVLERHLPRLEAAPHVDVVGAPGPMVERLILNLSDPEGAPSEVAARRPHPILGDGRVREALERAIDKQELVDGLLGGRAAAGTGELPVGWARSAPPVTPHDPRGAAVLLEAAGWERGTDGIRVAAAAPHAPDGTRLSLRLHTTTDSATRRDSAERLEAWCREVGVELRCEYVPAAAIFDASPSGPFRQGRFDLAMVTLGAEMDPHNYLEGLYASWSVPCEANRHAGWNLARYASPAIDEAIRRAAATPDLARRRRAYADLTERLATDRPHIYLYHRSTLYAHHRRLLGPVTNVWEFLGWNAADWAWSPAEDPGEQWTRTRAQACPQEMTGNHRTARVRLESPRYSDRRSR